MVKKRYKYSMADIAEDYCWIVGLSLAIGGALLWIKDPFSLVVSGVIIALIGAAIKGGRRL